MADASEFAPTIRVLGQKIEGYQILRAIGASVPNTIAAVLLAIRDRTGRRPHVTSGGRRETRLSTWRGSCCSARATSRR